MVDGERKECKKTTFASAYKTLLLNVERRIILLQSAAQQRDTQR